MTVISSTTIAKTGTTVTKILTNKIGDRSLSCVYKTIKLGEGNNSKLKALGVDMIDIHPHSDGSRYIKFCDKEGKAIFGGYTDTDVLKNMRNMLKALKGLHFNFNK